MLEATGFNWWVYGGWKWIPSITVFKVNNCYGHFHFRKVRLKWMSCVYAWYFTSPCYEGSFVLVKLNIFINEPLCNKEPTEEIFLCPTYDIRGALYFLVWVRSFIPLQVKVFGQGSFWWSWSPINLKHSTHVPHDMILLIFMPN